MIQNHTGNICLIKISGAVTVNILPAIVGAALLFLLALPILVLILNPNLGASTGLVVGARALDEAQEAISAASGARQVFMKSPPCNSHGLVVASSRLHALCAVEVLEATLLVV